MKLLTVKNDKLEATICPELGASIHSLRYNLNGQWVDIMRPTPQEAIDNKDPGAFSSFHLMPYSNRIEGGKLHYKGHVYPLNVNTPEGHTIHGDVRDRAWQVLSNNDSQMLLSTNSKDYDGINWPFPFSCKMGFEIQDNIFTISISIKNEGDKTMPAGFGSHPYFSKTLTEKDNKLLVKLPLKGLYPGDTPIPTGKWVSIPEHLDFSKERELNNSQFVDNCFRASIESSVIKWPGSGVTMTMDADEIYENIIFYTPVGKPFLAVEPVTNCNNGFNMAEEGISDTGTIYLKPGAEASGKITIKIEG